MTGENYFQEKTCIQMTAYLNPDHPPKLGAVGEANIVGAAGTECVAVILEPDVEWADGRKVFGFRRVAAEQDAAADLEDWVDGVGDAAAVGGYVDNVADEDPEHGSNEVQGGAHDRVERLLEVLEEQTGMQEVD